MEEGWNDTKRNAEKDRVPKWLRISKKKTKLCFLVPDLYIYTVVVVIGAFCGPEKTPVN